MNFIKQFFKKQPLTLSQLIFLNTQDGSYKEQIIKELKNASLVIGLAKPPTTNMLDFNDRSLQMLIIDAPKDEGFLLVTFVDSHSLKKRNATSFAYTVDFNTITKILENPTFAGLLVVNGNDHVVVGKDEFRV